MENRKGLLWLHLDTASRTRLLKTCPPRFTTIFCDHVTLRFGIPLTAEYEHLVGQTYTVTMYEHCWDDSIQAVRVDTHGLPDQYGVPHITISAADGVEPFGSVKLLRDGKYQHETLEGLSVTGTIQFVV